MTARNRLGASARGTPRVPPGAVTPPEALLIGAADFQTVGAGWPVTVAAALAADTNNANMQVRLFDKAVEEGVGFQLFLSSAYTQIELTFIYRAETAPGAPVTASPVLYFQQLPENVVVPAWSAGFVLSPLLTVPANEFWQYTSIVLTYANFGLTEDLLTNFELTRLGAGDTLVGDWVLNGLLVTLQDA